MNPTETTCRTGRLGCVHLSFWGVALYAALNVGAAPAAPILTVPAEGRPLHLVIPWPGERPASLSGRWQLKELDAAGSPVAAEVLAGSDVTGATSTTPPRLLATIPPRPGAPGSRRFELIPDRSEDSAAASFRWSEVSEKALGLWEGPRPVLVYNHGMQTAVNVPADRRRSTYLHPIYGLDGETLTDDFPKDHYHHRGLFWAWPHVRIDGRNYSLWDLRGIEQRFERWTERHSGRAAAVLSVENGWFVGDRKVVQEQATLTIYPAQSDGQVIDVDLTWVPLDRSVTLVGAEDKSYGGLTLRFAPRTNTVITTPLGQGSEDLAVTKLAWADLSAQFGGSRNSSGAAIFIHPAHPDFPPTWLTRHYGVLCVGWPGVKEATFAPGEHIHGQYRVWVHRGHPGEAELARVNESYQALQKVRWESDPP